MSQPLCFGYTYILSSIGILEAVRLSKSTNPMRSFLWACFIFLSGLVVAYVSAQKVSEYHTQQAQERFATQLDTLVENVEMRVRQYEHGLRGMRGVVNALWPDRLTYKEILRYANSREVEREFPGSRGFGFIQRVPRDQEADFLLKNRADDRPDFKITELNGHDHERFVIRYIEPVENNLQAVGLDIASENNRRSAAIQAMRSGEAVLTHPITLVQASGKIRHGFLLLLPAYTAGMPLETADQREAAAFGFAYTPLVMDEILQDLYHAEAGLTLSVLDMDDNGVNSSLFFAAGTSDVTSLTSELKEKRPLRLFGRNWLIEAQAQPAFYAQLNHTPSGQIFAQIALGFLLLAVVVYTLLELRVRKQKFLDQQARMAAIVESSNDAIISLDQQHNIRFFNSAAEVIFGFAEGDVQGKPIGLIFPELELQHFLNPVGLDQTTGSRPVVPIRARQTKGIHKRGGDVPTEVNLSVCEVDGEESLTLIARDISERKMLENQLRQQNDELERRVTARTIDLERARAEAEKLSQIKSEFLANMSHEIRTPLHAILGMISLLRESALDQEQSLQAETIQNSAQSLLGLINDILDISKIEAGKIVLESVDFNLQTLLESLTNAYKPLAERKGLSFSSESDVQAPLWLHGDMARIRQILTNLIGNAIKFTSKGKVSVICKILDANSGKVDLLFSIKDSGIGISQEQQKNLFQRFKQLDGSLTRRYGGTGLGLAISRQLAELLDGDVSVSSEPNMGSEFTFRVSLPRGKTAKSDFELLTEQQFEGRVLVVDDVVANQLLASMTLRRFGLAVDVADDGLAALRQLSMFRYDLVFMDMQMPEMDGLEATRKLRSGTVQGADSRVPVVAMTANAMEGDKQRCLEAGMDDYIAKPIDPAALQQVLRHWLKPSQTPPSEVIISTSEALNGSAAIVSDVIDPQEWNLAGMLERVMNDRNLAAKLLRAWLSEWPGMHEKLVKAVRARDAEMIGKQAHAIKGAAANLEALAVKDLAFSLEQAGRDNDLTQVDELLIRLEASQDRFTQAVRQEFADL